MSKGLSSILQLTEVRHAKLVHLVCYCGSHLLKRIFMHINWLISVRYVTSSFQYGALYMITYSWPCFWILISRLYTYSLISISVLLFMLILNDDFKNWTVRKSSSIVLHQLSYILVFLKVWIFSPLCHRQRKSCTEVSYYWNPVTVFGPNQQCYTVGHLS